MQNSFILSTVLILVGFMASQSNCQQQGQTTGGIEFFQGTWQQALKKSKLEKKPIFLDISASWCGPCKLLKRNTFSDEKVGAYFNKNFINVAVDGERGEGPGLAQLLNIEGYPSLFILDNSGKVLTASVGYQDPKEFLAFGESGFNKFKP